MGSKRSVNIERDGATRFDGANATSSAAGREEDIMAAKERAWQIRYLGSGEVFRRGISEGLFLVTWDDGREQKVNVELSEELVINIESEWPDIDTDPDSLIHRLGEKAIQEQLSQRGEVDKVICLYKDGYPGSPGRPDV